MISTMSIISWVSTVEDCPFSGVPLYVLNVGKLTRTTVHLYRRQALLNSTTLMEGFSQIASDTVNCLPMTLQTTLCTWTENRNLISDVYAFINL